eukprot:550037_1
MTAKTHMNGCSIDLEPTESTSLIKTSKLSFRPFIISALVLTFIIAVIFGPSLLFKQHSSVHVHQYLAELSAQDGNNDDVRCVNSDRDCNGHGICVYSSISFCLCDSGYTTHNPPGNTECNYKQKSQMTAFLLSLILGGFGAGRFYVGDYSLGVAKLLVFIMWCCAPCISMCCAVVGISSVDSDEG